MKSSDISGHVGVPNKRNNQNQYKPTNGLTRILHSDWLLYLRSICDNLLVEKRWRIQIVMSPVLLYVYCLLSLLGLCVNQEQWASGWSWKLLLLSFQCLLPFLKDVVALKQNLKNFKNCNCFLTSTFYFIRCSCEQKSEQTEIKCR